MGKIVKYCTNCEEGFAEKFSFCPNCAAALTAYEMNPMKAQEDLKADQPVAVEDQMPFFSQEMPEKKFESIPVAASIENQPATQNFSVKDEDIDLLNDEDFISDEKPVSEAKTEAFETPVFTEPVTREIYQQPSFEPETNSFEPTNNSVGYSSDNNDYHRPVVTDTLKAQDGLYHITFVEEKNASGRNLLLLGAFLLVTCITLGGVIYSLFAQNPYVSSLSENDVLVAYTEDTPPDPMELEKPPPKNKDDGGGGGGGGRENPEPVSKGRPPTQVERPIMPPQVLPQVTNASLPNPQETEGRNKRERTNEPIGSLTGGLTPSSGSGSGGGVGGGRGTGFGIGNGTGEGSGDGSGSGGGRGNGDGDGTGDGSGNPPAMPKPKPAPPVVQPFKIISKPRANYTDAARQNQVTGVVRVRVVFLPSGAIGSVTPLNSLPYGLTEQAISAAKQIRFEPQKSNGSPVAVTKVIEYSFSIF